MEITIFQKEITFSKRKYQYPKKVITVFQREIKVFCNEFDGGWIELHTENDFELAEKELEN